MIQLCIKNESELYNRFDPSRTRINDEVYHYLKSFSTEPEFQQNPPNTLQIITDEPIDQENFHEILLKAVRKDQNEFDRQIARRIHHRYCAQRPGSPAFGFPGSGASGPHFVYRFDGHPGWRHHPDKNQSRYQESQKTAGSVHRHHAGSRPEIT